MTTRRSCSNVKPSNIRPSNPSKTTIRLILAQICFLIKDIKNPESISYWVLIGPEWLKGFSTSRKSFTLGVPRFFEEVKEILETIPFGGDSMIWSTFLITTVTLTVTLADLSLSNNEKTPASAGVLTIIYGGERVCHIVVFKRPMNSTKDPLQPIILGLLII